MHLARRPWAVLAILPLLAACGSTVQLRGSRLDQPGLAPGTVADTTGTDGTRSSSTQSGGSGDAGPTGSGDGGVEGGSATQPSGGGPPSVPTAGPTSLPVKGRGYDATHLYIGLPVQTDVNQGAAALGFTNIDFGDQVAQVNAIVADINAHGGVRGRTVVAALKDVKTADLQTDSEGQSQSVCTYFTQDHPVVAVVNLLSAIDTPNFYRCLQKSRMPVVSAGLAPVDDRFLSQFRQVLYKSCCISMDRLGPVLLTRLQALGYFHPWNTTAGGPGSAPVKIGLLYGPDPEPRMMARIKAQLIARHYDVATDFRYASTSDMGSAVLKFRNAGVTHVVAAKGTLYYFTQAAESQHYRPRYAVNSYMGTYVAMVTLGAQPAQLKGSLGVGWIPVDDVADPEDPGPVGPAETHCHDVMLKAGQKDIEKRSVKHQAYTFCDSIHLVTDAMASANGFDPAAFQLGTTQLGTHFGSALTFRPGLAQGRPYIPGAVRDLGYDSSCSCFRYLSNKLYAV